MVESIKGTEFKKADINTQYDLLLNALTTVARLRNRYIEINTPNYVVRANYDWKLGRYVDEHNLHISDINSINSSDLQLVLIHVLSDTNFLSFTKFIPFFSVQKMRNLLLAYNGSIFYWRDYYAQYENLEAYANSLVGKYIMAEKASGTVLQWGYGKRAQWGIWLSLYNDYSNRVNVVFYELSLTVRENIRFLQKAKEENTLRKDALGMLMYPAVYWADNMIGRSISAYNAMGTYYSFVLESDTTYEYMQKVYVKDYSIIDGRKGEKTFLFNPNAENLKERVTRKPPHNSYID